MSIASKKTIGEIVRFGIVGVIATALHYAIYWLLQMFINVNIAYTTGYVLSFVCNFFMSSHFTFRSEATVSRGVGFGGAHLVNWLLQMVLLNVFLHLGLSNKMAPIPVFMICIPVNFLLVRYVFSRGGKNKKQEK